MVSKPAALMRQYGLEGHLLVGNAYVGTLPAKVYSPHGVLSAAPPRGTSPRPT
jgi:hypothetical protein